ncbi:aminotransferase class I/II-fold pyridoxal phosphate-dependent enzyme [Cryobacterium sp. CG_9.6]|uniref:DegT/DnrJ/EryC1/StrS family aminotransferase n=1 Tax=Cryobacterium sp. CG_9.6 TaxID=2760710 RepID=UPI00247505ED|nr:aminotransferase class I/II-fold pyridoxal phosphate-dependent enzyme [Cryobacterium sp. CG_9.6]MDH6235802.1 dTDP-4-amino-4,6-dideoxygalactose transaminase [Cryobacterium sp. CG_9.6]
MNERILLSAPDVGEREEAYVVAAMRSGWIAPLGPDVDLFEQEMAARVGVAHGVALSSGTAALHLGLLGLGAGPGTVVVTATMTFVATANAIVYTGAEPYFVDSDAYTGNVHPGLLREALHRLTASGERVAAIVPVDLLGKAADYKEIDRVAAEYGVPVLADAAESLGAHYRGRAVGSLAAASVVSFNGNKIMTTSGGGMLLTDDARLAEHSRSLSTQARLPVTHYEHAEVGYNYRMSNILAALGRGQLTRFDGMLARRRRIRETYRSLFAGVPGVTIFGGENDAEDNCWLTAVLVDADTAGWSAADLGASLRAVNIETRPLWKPMHLQPVYAGARSTLNGQAQRLFETGVSLPSGSALRGTDVDRVAAALQDFVTVYS